MSQPEPQGLYQARLRHFRESDAASFRQAGPIAGSKIPLIMMVLKVMVFNYPSAIDLGLTTADSTGGPEFASSSLFPFLVAGFLDYALVIAISSTLSVTVGWLVPDSFMANILNGYAQQTCYCIALLYRLRIAGTRPVLKALRSSYRQVLGSIKILLVALRMWPAIAWYIAIDRILGPNARRRMGILVLQMVISLYTGFWDDTAEQLTKVLEDGEEKSKWSAAKNGTLGWKGITIEAFKNTVTYVPIELFVASVPALLLLAQAGGVPRTIPWLGSLPVERWAKAIEERWTLWLGKLPGHYPVDPAEVERLNALYQRESQQQQQQQQESSSGVGKPPRFIRLLGVEARLYEDTVHCSLEWYGMEKTPKYKAISYAWGSSKLEETIILDGKPTKVTTSAFSALMTVRSEWRSRLFWVDALCINQLDPSDKAHDGSLALSAIHMLWTRITLHVEFGGELETADIPAPVWASIRRMLLATWFRRTWVVQEVVLARGITPGDNTIIRYGDGALDWQTLSWFIRNIRSSSAIVSKLLQGQTLASTDTIMSTIRNLETIQDFNTITFPGLKGISLTYYMTRMFRTRCDFQTKEDKDRVYDLLALPDKRTMSPAVTAVDYGGQTDAELFTKVAIHTLEDERIRPQCKIDFLAHAGLSLGSGSCTSAGDLPSWVPNWNLTSSSDGSAPQPPYPFLGLDGLRELTHGHMDYLFCRYIADMKTYGDINWGYEFSPGNFHGEYMGVLGKRLINTRKAFYRAGIPPEFINKENGSSEMEPRFELILASNSGTKPKLKVRGVPAARIAHLAEDVFPSPGSEREIILLPKARKEGQEEPVENEMEEYLNPRAFLPPLLAHTSLGDLTRREVDLKHDLEIPTRPMALAPPVSTMLGYEHLVRLYFGHKGGLYTPVAAVEQPKLLRDILESHPTRTSAFGPPSPGTTQPEEIQGDEATEIVSELIDLNKQVSDMCGGKMFGVTAGGKMGIFPAGTRVDDAVVVFWGSTVPFVLRKVSPGVGNNDNDNYQLVGACYVHGIMDGEALEGVEAGEGSDFVIV
ncbi:hypothetical protein V8F06_010617 [Rhypophila decipiens]